MVLLFFGWRKLTIRKICVKERPSLKRCARISQPYQAHVTLTNEATCNMLLFSIILLHAVVECKCTVHEWLLSVNPWLQSRGFLFPASISIGTEEAVGPYFAFILKTCRLLVSRTSYPKPIFEKVDYWERIHMRKSCCRVVRYKRQ